MSAPGTRARNAAPPKTMRIVDAPPESETREKTVAEPMTDEDFQKIDRRYNRAWEYWNVPNNILYNLEMLGDAEKHVAKAAKHLASLRIDTDCPSDAESNASKRAQRDERNATRELLAALCEIAQMRDELTQAADLIADDEGTTLDDSVTTLGRLVVAAQRRQRRIRSTVKAHTEAMIARAKVTS